MTKNKNQQRQLKINLSNKRNNQFILMDYSCNDNNTNMENLYKIVNDEMLIPWYTFINYFEYQPWIFSMLGSAIVGLSGIFPLLVIPIDEGADLKNGGKNTINYLLLINYYSLIFFFFFLQSINIYFFYLYRYCIKQKISMKSFHQFLFFFVLQILRI